jgi:hypothetical protein
MALEKSTASLLQASEESESTPIARILISPFSGSPIVVSQEHIPRIIRSIRTDAIA